MRVCLTYLAIDLGDNTYYTDKCLQSIDGYQQHTDFDIIVCTNKPDKFTGVKVIDVSDEMLMNLFSRDVDKVLEDSIDKRHRWNDPRRHYFNYMLKLKGMRAAADAGYDVVYQIDADTRVIGWDQESFEELLQLDYDVFVSGALGPVDMDQLTPEVERITKRLGWFDQKIISHREDRMIFKNNDRFHTFLDEAEQLSELLNINERVYATEALIIGLAEKVAGITALEVDESWKFAGFEKILEKTVLNRWWS